MGQPVGRNPTQYMMEKAFVAAGLDWRYLTLEVSPQDLTAAVLGMKAMGFRGGNFSLPHQVAVVEHMDVLSESASLIGAVNCVHLSEEKCIGENTVGKGFVKALRKTVDPEGKKAAVLGAGGTARAIAVDLGRAGVREITIVNRTSDRGQALVDLLNDKVRVPASLYLWEEDYTVAPETELLVNATAIGLHDASARVPVDIESLSECLIVADVIHNPPQTQLLQDAAERGCATLDGLAMLVNQAAIDFKIWTEIEPDMNVMRESLDEYFEL